MTRRIAISLALGLLSLAAVSDVAAQAPCADVLCWRVENRFRLFRRSQDFDRHERAWNRAATEAAPGEGRIHAAERLLQAGAGRDGWAAGVVDHLCFNQKFNEPEAACLREGVFESYLNPQDFAVSLRVAPPPEFLGAQCEWRFDGRALTPSSCDAPPAGLRARKAGVRAEVLLRRADGATSGPHQALVRPKLVVIAGLGDSFGSGEGNPDVRARFVGDPDDRPINSGQCFRRVAPSNHLVALPLRAPPPNGFIPDCPEPKDDFFDYDAFAVSRALWTFAPCHRSLYSQQLRTALALALEDEHRSVAFIPLACTGATSDNLLSAYHPAREKRLRGWLPGGTGVLSGSEAQIPHLRTILAPYRRGVDLALVSIGGNDIGFSGLVADLIIGHDGPEALIRPLITVSPKAARGRLPAMQRSIRRVGTALAPFVAGDRRRILVAAYPDPLLRAGGSVCFGMRRGFDLHPGFTVAGEASARAASGVVADLMRRQTAAARGMTFVTAHLASFAAHAVCDLGADEPAFDNECLRDGDSANRDFSSGPDNKPLSRPLACLVSPNRYAPYAPRARWWRTANDAYLASATFSDDAPKLVRNAGLHDGLWGLVSMTYGGAVHPSAEGHAAIADAALDAARTELARRGL